MATDVRRRKLIEVALPLEAINAAAAHEKSVPRKGHPATLHLWWARRPLAMARAVLFSQLVDDPSAHPDRFPTLAAQVAERDRLHDLIKRLVAWESTSDEELFAEAHAEIVASCDGNPPPILDPFTGGGTIPLEAQRLGLEAHASDLNPVAVLISKALIEIPPKFHDRPPVHPGVAESQIRTWTGAAGLAADVLAYGEWVRDEAKRRIGKHYPDAALGDGAKATVIAWLWARTARCRNPACSAEIPLLSTLWLCKKKGKEVWLRPRVSDGRVDFDVVEGGEPPASNKAGHGARFSCWVCLSPLSPNQIHDQHDQLEKPPSRLLALVAAGQRGRVYVSHDLDEQLKAAELAEDHGHRIRNADSAISAPARGTFGGNAQGRRYGFFTFSDYFTNRQLIALTTFSDLVGEAREQVLKDASSMGFPTGERLEAGGTDAAAYADAIATYLGFIMSKLADWLSSLCSWIPVIEGVRDTFARQALPMVWDFVEINPFSNSVGNVKSHFDWIASALDLVPANGASNGVIRPGVVTQQDAAACDCKGFLISTDPPYYDNIGYSDLSDYFYVWLRRTLHEIHPDLLSTLLVPKMGELVANSYRYGGKAEAKRYFEDRFRHVFARVRDSAWPDLPITVYYAFKQSESDGDGASSTGWETLLEAMVNTGWLITATWPMRSERKGRMLAFGTNALASSILLALRPRSKDAPSIDRRGFIAALHAELPQALRELQHGLVAPVDLPQAAIGPGMAVFSRYSSVIEADGSSMPVRAALARINEVLDQVLNEQEGDFDGPTRFAIAWYRQHGYGTGTFGDADNMARARGTAVEGLDRDGILTSRAGKVTLLRPADLHADYDVLADKHTGAWEATQHLIRLLQADGIPAAGQFLARARSRPDGAVDPELVKELTYLLFRIAEAQGWVKDALAFNTLATSWAEIGDASNGRPADEQGSFEFTPED